MYTVEEKVRLIRERSAAERTIRFDDLFHDDAIKMEVVVTFIAILELARRHRIRIVQTEVNGTIWVQVAPGADLERDADADCRRREDDDQQLDATDDEQRPDDADDEQRPDAAEARA